MSEFSEYADRLNMREQLARIDRSIDEAAKFRSERFKLDAEALKLRRDRFLAPALALAAMLGAIATVAPTLIRWLNLKLGVS